MKITRNIKRSNDKNQNSMIFTLEIRYIFQKKV